MWLKKEWDKIHTIKIQDDCTASITDTHTINTIRKLYWESVIHILNNQWIVDVYNPDTNSYI